MPRTSHAISARLVASLSLCVAAACDRGSPAPEREAAASAAPSAAASAAPSAAPMPAREKAAAEGDASLAVALRPRVGGQRAPGTARPATLALAETTAATPMIIRTGGATIEVDSLEVAIARVEALARRVGAVVASTSLQGGRETVRGASLELKVPAARFEELTAGLAPIGRLESLNVNAEDVSEEFVDVSARVANARRLESRLVTLLATRTGRLEDVLAVERELARVREEIERYDGRLRFLRTRAAVSTLTVSVHEPPPLVASHPGARPMRDALVEAWRLLVRTTAAVIVLFGALVPVAILGLAGWWVVRRVRAMRRQSGDAPPPLGPLSHPAANVPRG